MANNRNFEMDKYTISITGKHVHITEAIENYVKEKISKIEHFTNNILKVQVTLEVQKIHHKASIFMKFLHFNIQVHAITDDLYASIDNAFSKLYKLIRKYKDKLQKHKHIDLSSVDMAVHVLAPIDEVEDINDEIEKENLKEEEEKYKMGDIVAKDVMPLKNLTHDEAIMKLELSGDSFLIYREEEDQKLKVIYKRPDSNLGIVEVE